jgi:hypothetical protein
MKKHFLPLLFLLTVLFGLVSCTHQFKAKPNVSLKIPAKQLYRSIINDYEFDSADVEIKLFTDGKEFDTKSLKITKDTPEKPVSVSFEGVPLESTVYAQANVSITENERTIILLTGKSKEQVLTEAGLSLQIELKWTDESKAYIPNVNSEYFILKYNVYTYDSKKDIENLENYELKNTYTFKIYYKDFTNFTDSRCDELSSKIAELNFDMAITGYEQNTGIEEEGEPDLINGIAVLNSYWYKANKEVRPYLLNQKADISNYTLKLYKTAESSYYVIEDKDGKRLAVGVWMIGIANIEPIKYGIAFMQSLKYEDGVPKLSIEPNSQIPYTPEFHEISPDGLTIKNLIGDEEIEITFDTTGLEIQELMSNSNPTPEPDDIDITINCDNELYAKNSQITVTARNLTQNTDIPASDINAEISVSIIMNGEVDQNYSLYPDIDEMITDMFQVEQLFTIVRDENTLVITTDLPDGFIMSNENRYMIFDFSFTASDGASSDTQKISKIIKDGMRKEVTVTMEPDAEEIPMNQTVIFSAKDKNGSVDAGNITVELGYLVGNKWTPLNSSYYSVTHNNVNNSQELSFTNQMPIDTTFTIRVTVNSEETIFNVKVVKPVVEYTVSIDETDNRDTIIQNIKDVFSETESDFPNNQLDLVFEGQNISTDINLYGIIKDVLSEMNISYYGYGRILSLDYSGVTGSVVDKVPEEAFMEMDILKSIKLSESTTEIESFAFASSTGTGDKHIVTLEELDLLNVTKIDFQSFASTKILGEFNLPNVTQFGNNSCSGLHAEKVILGVAEELYQVDGNSEFGAWVFEGSTIGTLVADNLKRIENLTFANASIDFFVIPDSLAFVGSRAFALSTHTEVMFESESAKQNWYVIGQYVKVGGVSTDCDDVARGLYNGTINLSSVTAGDGVFELVAPDDLLDMMFDYSLQYNYIRITQ